MIPDLPHLRTLAEKATPGPWKAQDVNDPKGEEHWYGKGAREITGPDALVDASAQADAEYIAAANPETVLALLDLIDSLRRGQDRR